MVIGAAGIAGWFLFLRKKAPASAFLWQINDILEVAGFQFRILGREIGPPVLYHCLDLRTNTEVDVYERTFVELQARKVGEY